ncbi:RNA polymerase sigma factor [Chachezhania antarctica]|uniref:RNA polymerase sigma factor n=1 Tax=Chachezhania antarctica TaxID=2340860 RepID=UPI001F08CD17|nr:sigma factor-like helix-turn-helix DNA-binding protein [Chachezhania antarctica]
MLPAQESSRSPPAATRYTRCPAGIFHHAVEELSCDQIADIEGIPVGTVKTRTHHAKKALLDHLGARTRQEKQLSLTARMASPITSPEGFWGDRREKHFWFHWPSGVAADTGRAGICPWRTGCSSGSGCGCAVRP